MPEDERWELRTMVSLKHLPIEEWNKLLHEARERVSQQIEIAWFIASNSFGHEITTGDRVMDLVLAIYDRLSELMPRPFPEVTPAEEEEEQEPPPPLEDTILDKGGPRKHRDYTGGEDR